MEGDGHRAVRLSAAWIGLAAAAVVMLFIARDLKFQASHSGLEGMGAGIMLLLIYAAAGLIGLIAGIITLKTDGAISRTLFAIAAGAMIGTGIGQVTGPTYQPPQYYAASARVTVDISEPVELTSVDGSATCGSVANGTRIAQVNAYLGRIGPDRVALTLSLDSTSLEVGPYSSTGAASLTVAASADNRSGTVDFRGLVLRASDAPLRIAGRPSSISGRVEWSCAGTVIESWGDAPTLAPVPTNDDLADALVITGSTFEDTRSVERASLEPGEGVPCARGHAGDGAPTDRSIWYVLPDLTDAALIEFTDLGGGVAVGIFGPFETVPTAVADVGSPKWCLPGTPGRLSSTTVSPTERGTYLIQLTATLLADGEVWIGVER
jgi:hypothetical protein